MCIPVTPVWAAAIIRPHPYPSANYCGYIPGTSFQDYDKEMQRTKQLPDL
jgi:hypothetical protein